MPATVFVRSRRTSDTIRQVRGPLSAERCSARPMPKVSNIYGKMGLAYEKKACVALAALAKKIGATFEAQPWFRFNDANGNGQAVPDFLLKLADITLVGEIKYTFTPDAVTKLRGLYLPVVLATTRTRALPLVVCKTLTPDCTRTIFNLRDAFASHELIPTLQWLGSGVIYF